MTTQEEIEPGFHNDLLKKQMQEAFDFAEMVYKMQREAQGDYVMTTQEEALQMIEDCEARESRLSEWEAGFIDSLSKQIERGGALTEKQNDILHQIWDRVTENG